MIRKTLIITSLLLASALTGAAAPAASNAGLTLRYSTQPQPVTVTVAGTVRDKASGNPIPNATVRAHLVIESYQGPDHFEKCPSEETATDANGQYRLSLVTPLTTSGAMQGTDTLCVDAGALGYGTQPQYAQGHVTVQNCAFTNFNFDLSAGKSVRGVVADAAGQPVSGATVRVQNGMNGDWEFFGSLGRTVTGQDGSFQLWVGADSDYLSKAWLCILKPGTGSLIVWDFLAQEDLGTLTLNAGGNVAGRVLGADGTPLLNCEVSVRGYPFDLIEKAFTDQDGNYQLRALPGESSLSDFFKKKNGSYDPGLGKLEVRARISPELALKDAPHFQIMVKDGQTMNGVDLGPGADAGVSGTLLPSKTALSPGGLMVRLDYSWESLVEADLNGHFQFPYVPPGKHTLTAYLPYNLRYDRGIGQTNIEVQPGRPMKDVQVQLADLAELRVQYLDGGGNPLSGITAAATWAKSGDGYWTEGTVSDNEGWAVLYLYPDSPQYVGAMAPSHKLTAETLKEINPQPGQVMPNLQMVMVATASLSGRLLDAQGQPLAAKVVRAKFDLANGVASSRRINPGPDGRFQLGGLIPGVLKMTLEVDGVQFPALSGQSFELPPGSAKDLGDLVLKN